MLSQNSIGKEPPWLFNVVKSESNALESENSIHRDRGPQGKRLTIVVPLNPLRSL